MCDVLAGPNGSALVNSSLHAINIVLGSRKRLWWSVDGLGLIRPKTQGPALLSRQLFPNAKCFALHQYTPDIRHL